MATPNNQVRRRGSYAPLSAHYYLDDALAQAGEAAELLYVRGLAFCAATLSDGLITDAQLSRGPGVGMRDAEKRAERLVQVGAWERIEGGWRIRSWLSWNKSRDEILTALEEDRARKSRGGKAGRPTPPPGASAPLQKDSVGIPAGNHPEAERSPNGVHPASESNSTYTYSSTSSTSAAASDVTPDRAREPRRSGGPLREHPTPAELDATAQTPTGYRLVAAWANHNPGMRTAARRELGRAVDQLLAQGADPELIPDALDRAHGPRWRNPASALPHAYDDARRAAHPPPDTAPTGARPSTTDARVAAGLALAAQYARDETQADPPHLRAITGGVA